MLLIVEDLGSLKPSKAFLSEGIFILLTLLTMLINSY